MTENIYDNGRVYTDVQGLEKLRYETKTDPKHAKKEVAQQFEAILIQMVMRSMRDANKAFDSGLFGTQQMDFYQEMYDKQLSLSLSNSGFGFAAIVEKNIDQFSNDQTTTETDSVEKNITAEKLVPDMLSNDMPVPITAPRKPIEAAKETPLSGAPEEFVKKLWAAAKQAARALGTNPKILLAQAALETNWGKNIIPHDSKNSSHNLFNIKADQGWTSHKTNRIDSLEEKNGVLVKEKSSFRSYNSYLESFMDYVNFLKHNTRYSEVVNKASHPEQFIHALQNAGFATDSHYAQKILGIFSSNSFNNLIKKMDIAS